MNRWVVLLHLVVMLLLGFLSAGTYSYFKHPKIVYLPAPAESQPQEGAPDSTWTDREDLVWIPRKMYDELVSGHSPENPASVAGKAVAEVSAARDTSGGGSSIGLKLTTSRKMFTFNSLIGPSEVTVEAKAPCAVASFWAQQKFPQQKQYVEMMFDQWEKENPPPPSRFWSGFGAGAGTTLFIEAVIVIGVAIIVK